MTAAAYTAGELELLEAFSQKGCEERDVAGLLHAEAEDELARPIDRHSFDALRKKIWRTSVRRRSTLPQLLPSAPLQPPAAPQLCSAVALRPTGPPRVSLARVPYSKHANVAAALVEAVLHPPFSKLAADDLVTPSQRRMEYVTALAESLLLRFQPGTVAAVFRTWNRYVQWHLDQHLELTFRDVTVKKFLLAQEARGRTVPAAVFQHLKWLREELQVPVPLESPLLKPFASAPTNTWPRQVLPLQPQLWAHLLQLSSTRRPLKGVPLAAAFVVRFAVSGLRFRHCSRATLAPEMCNLRTSVWKVSAGKDGLPFAVSLPTCAATANDLLLQLQEAALRTIGASGPFLPDMYFEPHGGVVIRSACASSSRFLSFFRSLLMLPPLSLSADEANQFSTRSLRRFLPTVADALSLPESDSACPL